MLAMTKQCRFCTSNANHYIGGGMWVCFPHFIGLLTGRECMAKKDVFATHCSFCAEPSASFVGPESKPWARFCTEHGTAFTKANARTRGRMIERARKEAEGRL